MPSDVLAWQEVEAGHDARERDAVSEAVAQFHLSSRCTTAPIEVAALKSVLWALDAGRELGFPRYWPVDAFALLMWAFDRAAADQALRAVGRPATWLETRRDAGRLVYELRGVSPERSTSRVELDQSALQHGIDMIRAEEAELFGPDSESVPSERILWALWQLDPAIARELFERVEGAVSVLAESEARAGDRVKAPENLPDGGLQWLGQALARVWTEMPEDAAAKESQSGLRRRVQEKRESLPAAPAKLHFTQHWGWAWTNRLLDTLAPCAVLHANANIEARMRLGEQRPAEVEDSLDDLCFVLVRDLEGIFSPNRSTNFAHAFAAARGMCDQMLIPAQAQAAHYGYDDSLLAEFWSRHDEQDLALTYAKLTAAMLEMSVGWLCGRKLDELSMAQHDAALEVAKAVGPRLQEAVARRAHERLSRRVAAFEERFPKDESPSDPAAALALVRNAAESDLSDDGDPEPSGD